VHIDAITPSWSPSIVLQNVELWDTQPSPPVLIARARRVSVRFSLLDLPRALFRKSVFQAIGQITADDPWVNLSRDYTHRLSARAAHGSHPPLFALAWNHGTFQWQDPGAPHGAWTLYQSQGSIHLRGPSTHVYVRGGLELARTVEIRFWDIARYWRASATVLDGDVSDTLGLVERVTARPVLPAGWTAQGRYTLEIHGAGRLPMQTSLIGPSFIRKENIRRAQLNVPNLSVRVSSQTPAIQGSGAAVLRGPEMSIQRLTLRTQGSIFNISGRAWPFARTPTVDLEAASRNVDLSLLQTYLQPATLSLPPLHGSGNVTINVSGAALHPDLTVMGRIPRGEFWKWPFQEATLRARRRGNRWEVEPTTAKVGQGTLSFQGTATPEGLEFQLGGTHLSLPESGSLNFSASLHGPVDHYSHGFLWN
jgi:hypothetical protein